VLGEFYDQMIEDGMDFEIIFISSDSDIAAFQEYYGSMPWTSLPFANQAVKQNLGSKYGVRGIPSFIVLNGATGEVVDKDGRTTVVSAKGQTDKAWKHWQSVSK
jgi:nucleoredoxin